MSKTKLQMSKTKFIDLFDFVVNINEVQDTKIPPKSLTTEAGGARAGHIVIKAEDYFIHLEPKTYKFDGKTYTFINIAFKKAIDGKESEDLTFDNKAGSTVIGAIFNAASDEVKKYEVNAIVFIAKDNVEQRMRIYNNLTSKFHPDFLACIKNITIPSGKMTIIFNTKIKIPETEKFIEYLKKEEKI